LLVIEYGTNAPDSQRLAGQRIQAELEILAEGEQDTLAVLDILVGEHSLAEEQEQILAEGQSRVVVGQGKLARPRVVGQSKLARSRVVG
jgi:hypothetical protein